MAQVPAEDTPREWSIGELLHEMTERVFSPGSWQQDHAHRSIDKQYPAEDTKADTGTATDAPTPPPVDNQGTSPFPTQQ